MKNIDLKSFSENTQRIYLDDKYPLIIRLDGVNVTKNHDKINLITSNFTQKIFSTGVKIFKQGDYNGYVFAILDEVNFCFNYSYQFFKQFDDTNQLYCGGIFLQNFIHTLPAKFKSVNFGISVFNTNSIRTYLYTRQHTIYPSTIMYFAKEYLPKNQRYPLPLNEILNNIQQNKLYLSKFKQIKPDFFNGLLYKNMPNNGEISLDDIPKRN